MIKYYQRGDNLDIEILTYIKNKKFRGVYFIELQIKLEEDEEFNLKDFSSPDGIIEFEKVELDKQKITVKLHRNLTGTLRPIILYKNNVINNRATKYYI